MKKIFFSTYFLIFSFSLMAQETTDSTTEIKGRVVSSVVSSREKLLKNSFNLVKSQDNESEYEYNKTESDPIIIESTFSSGKYSLIIGAGLSDNNIQLAARELSDAQYSSYEDVSELAAKSNLNIALLRRLADSNFSLGFDFTIFVNGKYKENNYYQNGNTYSVDKISIDYYLYTLMLLANYELLQTDNFDLSIQYGMGYAFNTLDIKVHSTYSSNTFFDTGTYKGSSNSMVLTSKLGLLGNFYFYDNFAIGLGTYYSKYADSEFIFGGNTVNNLKLKNSGGMISYNINMKFIF